jgi:hypothetical protein
VPWSTLCRADWVRNDPVLTTRGWLLRHYDAVSPGAARLRALVRSYIEDTATQEWPMMAQHTATLSTTPRTLAEALQVTLALAPSSHGQQTAQREITTFELRSRTRACARARVMGS